MNSNITESKANEATGYTNQSFTPDQKSSPENQDPPPAYEPPAYSNPAQYPPANAFNQAGQAVVVPPAVVSVQPVGGIAVVQQVYVPPPNSYCCLSCCIFWFCNFLFGLIAFVFSMMSMSAYDGGNLEKARSYGRISLWLNVAGIVVTSVFIFILTIVLLV